MNVCSADHVFGLARLRAIVEFVPPRRAPTVPVTVRVAFVAPNVVVATVLTSPVEPTYAAPCERDER